MSTKNVNAPENGAKEWRLTGATWADEHAEKRTFADLFRLMWVDSRRPPRLIGPAEDRDAELALALDVIDTLRTEIDCLSAASGKGAGLIDIETALYALSCRAHVAHEVLSRIHAARPPRHPRQSDLPQGGRRLNEIAEAGIWVAHAMTEAEGAYLNPKEHPDLDSALHYLFSVVEHGLDGYLEKETARDALADREKRDAAVKEWREKRRE